MCLPAALYYWQQRPNFLRAHCRKLPVPLFFPFAAVPKPLSAGRKGPKKPPAAKRRPGSAKRASSAGAAAGGERGGERSGERGGERGGVQWRGLSAEEIERRVALQLHEEELAERWVLRSEFVC